MKEIEDLFHEFYSPLCNYATKIIGDDTVAEDIVQNLFIQLWEKDQLKHINHYEAYLLKSTRFKCLDYFRAQKRKKEVSTDQFDTNRAGTPTVLKEEDIEPLLYYFAAKLPPKTRKVFLMSRRSGMTYKEIAEELEVSIKTVENQMGSALKKMRVILREQNFFSLLFL